MVCFINKVYSSLLQVKVSSGVDLRDIAHFDLYSCFPVAVSNAVTEMGLDDVVYVSLQARVLLPTLYWTLVISHNGNV